MLLRLALILLTAFGALMLAALPRQATAQVNAPDTAAERQILVMLRMVPPHYSPGGSYGGSYGGASAQAARERVARSIGREFMLEIVDSWPMPTLGVDCFVLRIPDNRDIDELIKALSANPNVSWSQKLNTYFTRAASDPLFEVQPTARKWQLGELHRLATGKGVKIAVIDSQIDARHPDLVGQIIVQRDFVGSRPAGAENHGTGIAGVIAAKAENGLGIAGVAPGARLMALRACAQGSSANPAACDSLALARAIEFAIENGADVVNLSLSGPSDRLLAELIEQGLKRKISFVTAYDPSLPKGGFPASLPGVLPIADEAMTSPPPGVYLAPGRDVPVTMPGGKWGLASGNSFATAQVSGLLALAREKRQSSATPFAPAPRGGGTIDACATLTAISPTCNCECSVEKSIAKRK